MFAVVRTGGKQYRVAKGDVIKVERLAGEIGSPVHLGEVLMVAGPDGTTVGTPLVEGIAVSAQVVKQDRGPKIIVFKKKRRQNYRRKKGHRQDLTVLQITGIGPDGMAEAAAAETAPAEVDDAAPAEETVVADETSAADAKE